MSHHGLISPDNSKMKSERPVAIDCYTHITALTSSLNTFFLSGIDTTPLSQVSCHSKCSCKLTIGFYSDYNVNLFYSVVSNGYLSGTLSYLVAHVTAL